MPDATYPRPPGLLGHARVAVLTIIKEEFEAARQVLNLPFEVDGTGYVASGAPQDGQYDVVLCEATERSNVASATLTKSIIEDFRPEVILLVGIAGGMLAEKDGIGRDGVALGDVVVADLVSYTEFMKIAEGKLSLRYLPIDQPSVHLRGSVIKPVVRSFDLNEAVKAERPDKATKPKVLEGEIVSGEKVWGGVDDAVQVQLLGPFEKALAVDMESYGMARAVCERRNSVWYNPRYLVIRGISDMVGVKENNETRAKWKSYAAHTASCVAKAFVERFLKGVRT
jgi:nucleoside phosphorylase